MPRQVGERITYGQGYKQIEEGITVVHLKGSEAEIQEQVEALLKDEIAAFDAVISRNRMIQGLGGGCTNFAAFGPASADGQLWHGRNFDFYGLGAMDRYRVVYIVEPEGRIPFVAIGWPGWGGPELVHTAMNAEGISLGYNWADSNQEDIAQAPQLWRLLRRVIEEASTLDEAIAILQQGPRFSAANLLIADGKVPEAIVVEMSSTKMTVRRASDGVIYATNHFVTPEMQEPIKDPNSFARYQRIGGLLQADYGQVDLEKVISFLRDHYDVRTRREELSGDVIAWNINVQSAVFSPTDLTFWVAKGLAPAVYGEYVGFSLGDELAGTQAGTQLPVISEDPIIQSSAYATFQTFQAGYIAYLEGDYARAVAEIEKAVAASPDSGRYYFVLASAYMNQQEYPEAIRAFEAALATNMNEVYQAYSYYRLAMIYQGMGDEENMRAAFQRVLELAIGDPTIEDPARRALESGS
ncbi:MAG: C45 family autoproteolytic acyltransferase/hydrolase [Chloroflexota bacterium]